MKTPIGVVTIEYDQAGKVITSLFEPTMTVTLDEDLNNELRAIECCADPKTLEHNASLVLSSFFNRVNKIELRDVAKSHIESHIDHLEEFPDKRIKKAIISYSFHDDGL